MGGLGICVLRLLCGVPTLLSLDRILPAVAAHILDATNTPEGWRHRVPEGPTPLADHERQDVSAACGSRQAAQLAASGLAAFSQAFRRVATSVG